MTITRETVRVTAEHIAHGKRGAGPSPVELALSELHPGIPVDAYSNWAHLCGTDDGCLNADLPPEAEGFERAFENGQAVAPLEFTVRWEAAEEEDAEDEPACPPSAVVDQIIPWAEVREGDLLLWDGEFRHVEDICPLHSRFPGMLPPGEWLVRLDGDLGPGAIPAGAYAAVRRYKEN